MTFRKTALALACALHAGLLSTVHAAEADQALQLDASTIVGQADDAAERDSYQAKPSSAATKLELTPRETPQSVSTITRAQLDDFKLTSVNDALKYTPGIAVQEVETDRTYFTARGFDITNFQYDGIGAPFVYGNLDGSIDTAPFERIEVVRGANGLMSGTGNPSATINFVRKRPTATQQARILGLPGRILVSFMGLMVAMLSLTGIVIWLKKRAARRQAALATRMPEVPARGLPQG